MLQYILHQHGMHFKARAKYHLLSQHIFQIQTNTIYNHKGKEETITSLIIGPNKHAWLYETENKLIWSAQGNNHGVQSTETIDLIFFI